MSKYVIINKFWLVLAFSALTTLLIATHIPQKEIAIDLEWFNMDKLIHAFAYGVVFALFVVALGLYDLPRRLLLGAAILLVIGALDELTQGYVGRTGSVQDWAADAVGIACIAGFVLILRRRKKPTGGGFDANTCQV